MNHERNWRVAGANDLTMPSFCPIMDRLLSPWIPAIVRISRHVAVQIEFVPFHSRAFARYEVHILVHIRSIHRWWCTWRRPTDKHFQLDSVTCTRWKRWLVVLDRGYIVSFASFSSFQLSFSPLYCSPSHSTLVVVLVVVVLASSKSPPPSSFRSFVKRRYVHRAVLVYFRK